MERLEAVRQGCRPLAEDALHGVIEPAFTLTEIMPSERYFLAIAGPAFSEMDDAIQRIFIWHFKPPFIVSFDESSPFWLT